jgi:putative DNA primase/helicase
MSTFRHPNSTNEADIWQMLQFIPAHDRDIWVKVGMALKSHLGDAGWPMFDDWSQTADNYQASAARSTWRSFRGSGVGIGSLIHMAKQNGRPRGALTTPAPAPRRAPRPQQSNKARYAAELWLRADKGMQADDWLSHPSPDELIITHPYAIAKRIVSAGGAARGIASGGIIGKNADCLIVPIRENGTGKVQGVQCISGQPVDDKWPKQTFGSMTGGYLLLGNTKNKDQIWYVLEGWASAYAMVFHHLKGNACAAVSFGKTNQRKVAELVAEHHKPERVRILQERD